MEEQSGWRKNLIETVLDLASAERQQEYAIVSGLHPSDVPGELICQWGDDLYEPEMPGWAEHFSEEERAAMQVFNQTFEREVKSYRTPESWQRIMEAAKTLAEQTGWTTSHTANL